MITQPVSRRRFLEVAGKSCIAIASISGCSTFQQASHARPLVGSNIYGWGQYAQRENRKLEVPVVMSALRDCGYDYLEGFMNVKAPEDNAKFAADMRAHGLRPVSIYAGALLHEPARANQAVKELLAAATVCAREGFQVLTCNPAPVGREKTDAELKTQAEALTDVGEGLRELGMHLAIHQHLPEMASNAREFHYVFQNTKPSAVGWCYDVHWVWKGGVHPSDALRQYGNRLVTWHLRQSRDRIWWEDLDTGDIDYSAIAAYTREHGLPRRFTVELALQAETKITRSIVENHRRSREFVRGTFGV